MSFDDRIEYYLELDPTLSYEEAMELVLQEDEDYEDEDDYLDDWYEDDDYIDYGI